METIQDEAFDPMTDITDSNFTYSSAPSTFSTNLNTNINTNINNNLNTNLNTNMNNNYITVVRNKISKEIKFKVTKLAFPQDSKLPPKRFGHTASISSDYHRFAIHGGSSYLDTASSLKDLWVYDFLHECWSMSMDTNLDLRYHQSLWVESNIIFLFGGKYSNGLRSGDVVSIDGIKLSELPIKLSSLKLVKDKENNIWIFGGNDENGMDTSNLMYLPLNYLVDAYHNRTPTMEKWRLIQQQPCWPSPRSLHGMVYSYRYNSIVVIYGALNVERRIIDDIWLFDCESHTWKEIVPKGIKPEPRNQHILSLTPDSRYVIMIGGMRTLGNQFFNFNDCWIFDLDRYKWKKVILEGDAIPRLIKGTSCMLPPSGNRSDAPKLYVCGGIFEENDNGDLYMIQLPTNWGQKNLLNQFDQRQKMQSIQQYTDISIELG